MVYIFSIKKKQSEKFTRVRTLACVAERIHSFSKPSPDGRDGEVSLDVRMLLLLLLQYDCDKTYAAYGGQAGRQAR